MRSHPLVIAACLLLVAAEDSPALALTPGGGPQRSDCVAEFGGTPANYPPDRPREIRCTDGDPACDQDPTVAQCGIAVSACLNVTDPALPDCAAQRIVFFDVRNFEPTSPGYDPGFTTLRDEVRAMLPLPETEHDRCTTDGGQAPVLITVPLRFVSSTQSYRKRAKTLRTHLDYVFGSGTKDDFDSVRIVCLPASSAAAPAAR